MKNMKSTISANIRYLRECHKLTQEDFAEKLEVSRQTVAKWENGESLPDIERCAVLCFMFNISIDSFTTLPLSEEAPEGYEHSDGNYVFGIVKVGERGQVVIPKYARDVYGIKSGDKLLAVGNEKGMALAKVKSPPDNKFGK